MARVDLNSDLGESFGRYSLGLDDQVIPLVTSVNIACGMHAGDPCVMRRTVAAAAAAGTSIGAHPGYPDLQGFGRRDMALSPDEAYSFVLYQISALAGFCKAEGTALAHVKPHGSFTIMPRKTPPSPRQSPPQCTISTPRSCSWASRAESSSKRGEQRALSPRRNSSPTAITWLTAR